MSKASDGSHQGEAANPTADTDLESLRDDVEGGLRFLHLLTMQMKQDLYETTSESAALIKELVKSQGLDAKALAVLKEESRETEAQRLSGHAYVQMADTVDKYALQNGAEIDCASRLHLCKAKCCSFTLRLSLQDLEEGVIKWDYARPYSIREKPSGYCVHSCEGSGNGCEVYEQRPAACRTYDCRNDSRIWADFEGRIPASHNATEFESKS